MTRKMQYNFLYPVHKITTVHCAVPLSLLTAQHSQTVLNTEQRGVVRQRAVSNSNTICNYSNGDMLRQNNYIALEHKYFGDTYLYKWESSVKLFMKPNIKAA